MGRVTLAVVVVLWTVLVSSAAGFGVAGVVAQETADGAGQCGFPHETTDATGTTVSLDAAPERIVTLNPSAAQTMWEIGARDQVVGLTKYANYLEGAGERANVSGATDIVVVEQVVKLEPDLVLAPNATPAAAVEQLRATGLTVYRFPEAKSIPDVYAKTRAIGRLVGECEGADATVASMRERVETARAASAGRERPDVLYAFFGYTAGRGTFIHEVIETAGGNNVAADYNVTGYQKLNPEVVVEADPDWIIRNSENPMGLDPVVLDQTSASRENRIVVVPIEHINQPAPRVVRTVTTLVEQFHPEAYAAANATPTGTSTPTESPSRTEAPSTTTTGGSTAGEPTTSDGQPGFGVLAAVLAMAVSVLVGRGRR